MPARWSADSVLALAPDDSSRRAAGPLARPASWTGAGATGDSVWGLCAGSGRHPYQVTVDLAGPAFKCTCPSRKFPCKHALALLLLWSAGSLPDADQPVDFARAWLDARRDKREKAEAAAASATPPGAAGGEQGSPPGPRDAAGTARRAAERAGRVTAGLAELQEWLRDQVRVGLAAAAAPRSGGLPGAAAADLMAARLVDAQAPGVAGTLRGLSGLARGSDPALADWPARLLAEYGLLHLLTRAHERLGELPDDLAAVVRSRVGYPVSRHDVLARPAVAGRWLVLAVRDLTDAAVPGRRVWLREAVSGQWAMLLTFATPQGAWQDPDAARLRPGTEVLADLHYYPGEPALRAVLGQRRDGDPDAGSRAAPGDGGARAARADGIGAMLTQWAGALEADPWLTTWPVLLSGTPVAAAGDGDEVRWQLADQAGNALPLAARESLWTLLAVSGGQPVTVAGEWHPDGLVALTTWHGEEVVPL